MGTKYVGIVVRKRVAAGSKSDREAVCLSLPDGEWVLRREAGPTFQDPVLEELVGKTIQAVGREHGYMLIISSWQELDGAAKKPAKRARKK
jgi:hypothetical protein